jgi:hypothetical protein
MSDLFGSFVCPHCGTTLSPKDEFCPGCEPKEAAPTPKPANQPISRAVWVAVAMLTFPLWGIALFAWLAKTMEVPRAFDFVALLAVFSPLPIVLSKKWGVWTKLALVFGYYWIATPIAVFTLFMVMGQT